MKMNWLALVLAILGIVMFGAGLIWAAMVDPNKTNPKGMNRLVPGLIALFGLLFVFMALMFWLSGVGEFRSVQPKVAAAAARGSGKSPK